MAKRIVILGAGYGGVKSAHTLMKKSTAAEAEIILVNKHSYHQFITEIHESATGLFDSNNVRVPLAEILDEDRVKVVKDTVLRIFPGDNRVILENGTLDYDYLIVGLGSEPEYFSIPGLEQYSLTLRSLNSAKLIKTQIENNFARYKANPMRQELLTVIVGGAGFTGIELTGELADWLPILARQYDIPERQVSLICIEASSSILKDFDRHLIDNAYLVLRDKGVRIITDTHIEGVTENEVRLSGNEVIRYGTFVWTGGIRANKVVTQAGFAVSVRGRAAVNKYLQAVDFPNVYLIGDNAFITDPNTGDVMAPTAQVAIQSGYVAALNILADIRGAQLRTFYPHELGRVVSLGRNVAAGKIGKTYKTKGRIAGFLKEAIHWKYLFSIGGFKLVAKKLFR